MASLSQKTNVADMYFTFNVLLTSTISPHASSEK